MDDEQLLLSIKHIRHRRRQGKSLPAESLRAALVQRERDTLKTSLHAFLRAAWPHIVRGHEFIPGKHIEAMCEHLEAVKAGQIKRLLINVPYRSTKSNLVSVAYPAWEWADDPSLQYLCFSHKQQNATRDTRAMRALCRSEWYQERWQLGFAKDQNLKHYFLNDDGGTRIAAGMTTSVMGANADRIIIDDPMSVEESFSDAQRQTIFMNYDEEISRRLNVPGESAIIICGQRVDCNDFFSHVLEDDADVWEHLVIPMRYESDHPYQRSTSIGWSDWRTEEGELMCAERFPEEYVQSEEMKPGASGQLQQRPTRRGGGMFRGEWFQIVDAAPAEAQRVRAWDKAATEGAGAYTTGVLMSRTSAGVFHVEDVVRQRTSPAARYALLKQVAEIDAARYGYGAVEQCIEEEGGSAGKDAAWMEVNLLAGHSVHTERPTGSKEFRAQPFAAQAEAGNVRLVRGDWVPEYLRELQDFPAGKYKDQVDATSASFMRLATGERGRYSGPLIASGEDPVDESRPFADDELAELPDFLRELVVESRASGEEARQLRRW